VKSKNDFATYRQKMTVAMADDRPRRRRCGPTKPLSKWTKNNNNDEIFISYLGEKAK
jgi:hypothetical protein